MGSACGSGVGFVFDNKRVTMRLGLVFIYKGLIKKWG